MPDAPEVKPDAAPAVFFYRGPDGGNGDTSCEPGDITDQYRAAVAFLMWGE